VTIDDVLARLDEIVDRCHDRGSRLGFFPAMYRKTTQEVKVGIETGRFEDPERMERLDVVFALRYLRAFERLEAGDRPRAAWDYAFLMARSPTPTVVQHLLLGMNAHINLDLGVSAADVAPGESLYGLKRDFDTINQILGEMVDDIQADLANVFPLMAVLDFLCLRFDERAVHAAICRARAGAWDKACTLAHCVSPDQRQSRIVGFDRQTLVLAQRICPPRRSRIAAAEGPEPAVDARERETIRRVIDALVS
jgi:hypothetical protein